MVCAALYNMKSSMFADLANFLTPFLTVLKSGLQGPVWSIYPPYVYIGPSHACVKEGSHGALASKG